MTQRLNTGKKLWSTRAHIKPSSLSCANFEMYIYVGGFGDTTGAMDTVNNPDPVFADFPSVVLLGSFVNRVQALYQHH